MDTVNYLQTLKWSCKNIVKIMNTDEEGYIFKVKLLFIFTTLD